ncbi:unnamed protein product [Clonostachys rhizophaga]|uniref:Uncharacterized protein n=1 Tax=Clonostachys rhizophaga TaxID=160324 RepID=A0A9N9YT30_9HYPO|nr:unnamed protein product [Clonostachys rhizophaga]
MPPIRTQGKKRGAAVALTSPLKAHEPVEPKRTGVQRTIESYWIPTERATVAAQRDTISTVEALAQATRGGADEAHIGFEASATDGTRALEEFAKNEGRKEADFRDNREWETYHRNWLGKKTKMVGFGSGFNLQDEHINKLISVGPHICRNLTHFTFDYRDVSYGAKNSASDLTDEAVVRLVKLCPKLRCMQLQGASGLTDITLEAIFRHCPDISYVELTTTHGGCGKKGLNGSALQMLREHPDWGTKLKTLRFPDQGYDGRNPLTRAVRALTKERDMLSVELVSVLEYKKWGDWELEVRHDVFRNGRKQSRF